MKADVILNFLNGFLSSQRWKKEHALLLLFRSFSASSCICRSSEVEDKLIAGASSMSSRCRTPRRSQSGVPITCRVQPEQLSEPGAPRARRARMKTRPGSRDVLQEPQSGARMAELFVGIDVAKAELAV